MKSRQVGEVVREPHRVRLVDSSAGFGGGRRWAGRLFTRTLARSHFGLVFEGKGPNTTTLRIYFRQAALGAALGAFFGAAVGASGRGRSAQASTRRGPEEIYFEFNLI